jgi:hypothetical protein
MDAATDNTAGTQVLNDLATTYQVAMMHPNFYCSEVGQLDERGFMRYSSSKNSHIERNT